MSCRLLHRGVRGAGVARYLLPRLQLFMYEKGTPRIRLVPELRVKAAQHLRLRDGEGFDLIPPWEQKSGSVRTPARCCPPD